MAYEKDEQAQCLELCDILKFCVWRNNSGVTKYQNKDGSERFVRYGFKGAPDLMGYIPKSESISALPFYWEVKRSGGKIRPEQRSFIQTVISNGCFAGIGTFDDLREKLLTEGYFL